jgi:hypothetical protein
MLSRYRDILIALFKKVHDLHSARVEKRMLALEIQEELLLRLVHSERIVRKTKKAIKNLKSQLSTPGKTKEESSKIKKRIKGLESNLVRQNHLMWCLRTVGDAIAFIYGDKWEIKNYALKQDAGFISGKKGTRLERSALRYAFKVGGTAVMNDLTNSLRHADITIFRPDLWPDGYSPMLFFEAKSGKGGNKERAERQRVAIKEITEYVYTDKREFEDGIWHRVDVISNSEHHSKTVNNLIQQLPNAGQIIQEVEPGLFYALVDCSIPEFDPNELFAPISERTKNVLMLSVGELKGQTLGYYPFTLAFIDPNQLYRFYNGSFLFMILVDLDTVNNKILNNQLEIHLTNEKSYPWQIVSKISTDDVDGSYIGFHIIGRLAAEFIRLDWLVENIVAMEGKAKKKVFE